MTYSEAINELKVIVADLEGERLDVDEIGPRVARARELVEFCRSRVEGARAEVARVSPRSEQG